MKICVTCGLTFTRSGLAQRYCSPACRVSNSPEYKTWKTAERRPPKPGAKRIQKRQAKRLATALALRAAGLTLKAIGEKMGLTKQRVHQVLAAAANVPNVQRAE